MWQATIHQLGTGSPHFQTALSACNHLLPTNGGSGSQQTAQQQRTQLADELTSKCMRSRGVSGFPNPTAQGDLSVEMVQAQGIDVHSPADDAGVVQACLPASHGGLTPAKVRRRSRTTRSLNRPPVSRTIYGVAIRDNPDDSETPRCEWGL